MECKKIKFDKALFVFPIKEGGMGFGGLSTIASSYFGAVGKDKTGEKGNAFGFIARENGGKPMPTYRILKNAESIISYALKHPKQAVFIPRFGLSTKIDLAIYEKLTAEKKQKGVRNLIFSGAWRRITQKGAGSLCYLRDPESSKEKGLYKLHTFIENTQSEYSTMILTEDENTIPSLNAYFKKTYATEGVLVFNKKGIVGSWIAPILMSEKVVFSTNKGAENELRKEIALICKSLQCDLWEAVI